MIKANKEGQRKTPILRFKGFTDDWEQRKLREISSSTIGGGTPKSSNKKFWNGNIPWIQSSDLVNDDIWNITIKKHITLNAVENSAAKIISANSIAVVTRVAVGKLVYMPLEYATSQDFISFQNLSGDHSFFMYLVSKVMHKVRGSLQGTSIKGISKGELLKKKVIYTLNIKEQKKIGTLLKSLDTILTLYERKLKLLSQVKKYFLDNLFAEKEYPNLRFKGFTDAWEQRELREIAKKRTEKNRNLLTNNVLSNSAIYGIVKQTEYFNKSIANNIQNYYLVYENDFVYNPRISNNAPFGPISRNKLNELGVMSPLYLVFYFSTKSLSDYLEIYFKSSKWHKFMYMSGNSGARSDRFAIKDNDFFRMKIKMPHSKDEINKIYKFNILLYKLLTLYENKQQYLTEIKNTLLNTMFI